MKSNDWLLKYLVMYIILFGAIFIPTAYLISHSSGKAVNIRKAASVEITDVIICDIEDEGETILLNKVLTNQEVFDVSRDSNYIIWKSEFAKILSYFCLSILSILLACIVLIVVTIIIYGVYLLFKD